MTSNALPNTNDLHVKTVLQTEVVGKPKLDETDHSYLPCAIN